MQLRVYTLQLLAENKCSLIPVCYIRTSATLLQNYILQYTPENCLTFAYTFLQRNGVLLDECQNFTHQTRYSVHIEA